MKKKQHSRKKILENEILIDSEGADQYLAIENELILNALHQAQEKLATAYIDIDFKQSELAKVLGKLERVYSQFPNYWDAAAIDYSLVEVEPLTVEWLIYDTTLANRSHAKIVFTTITENSLTNILLSRESDNFDAFEKYPLIEALDVSPWHIPSAEYTYLHASNVGTSDWKTIKALIEKLQNFITDKQSKNISHELTESISAGLSNLNKIIEDWPLALRYDSASLMNIINSGSYNGLDIELNNLQLGAIELKTFRYRLSSVTGEDLNFGKFPRIEFYEDTARAFQNWFCESFDAHGRRLELRFAIPNDMDFNVWRRLSGRDQLLIAALISKMPDIIADLIACNAIDANSKEWAKMTQKMKSILRSTLQTIQKPRTKQNINTIN